MMALVLAGAVGTDERRGVVTLRDWVIHVKRARSRALDLEITSSSFVIEKFR